MTLARKLVLVLLLITSSIQIAVLLLSGANFLILITRGFYSLDYQPQLSQVSDWVWNLFEYINSFLGMAYLGGIVLNCILIIAVFGSLNPTKWRIYSAYLTGIIPVLLIVTGKIFFKAPISESGFSYQGYSWKKYEFEIGKITRADIWRSELCSDCYQPNERIRWLLIESREIKNGY